MNFIDKNEQKKTISDCLDAMYIRYRKKKPEFFDREVKFALRDFADMEPEEIKKSFGMAYSKYDKMPTMKEIISHYRSVKSKDEKKELTCGSCVNGFRSMETVEGTFVTTRCPCALGEQHDKRILLYRDGVKLKGKKND